VSWEFLTSAWTLAVVPSAIAIEIGPALWDGLFGNASEAKKRALVAANLSKDRDVEYGAAFALILAGESERSQMLVKDLDGGFPRIQRSNLCTCRERVPNFRI
jgi:hypothetical protein